MATIDNLTNTTWKFNSTITTPSSNIAVNVTNTENIVKLGTLSCYNVEGKDAFYKGYTSSSPNPIGLTVNTASKLQFTAITTSTQEILLIVRTFTVLAGTTISFNSNFNATNIDTTNIDAFYTWLSANAVKQVDTIKFSSNAIDKLYFGSSEMDALYLGSNKLYELVKYTITVTTTNCTASASNPSTIVSGRSATLVFSFDGTSYQCPSTAPTVTGATGTWTKDSDTQGTMVLSSASGNVSFTVEGEVSSGYTVIISNTAIAPTPMPGITYESINVYDGNNPGGTLLGSVSRGSETSFIITSGYVCLYSSNLAVITSSTCGTITQATGAFAVSTVISNGTIVGCCYYT